MNPRVKKVKPLPDYRIHLVFSNGEEKIFDVKPYLETGVFKELRKPELFNSVRLFMGSVSWANGQDFCPDTLYMDGTIINAKRKGKKRNLRSTTRTPSAA